MIGLLLVGLVEGRGGPGRWLVRVVLVGVVLEGGTLLGAVMMGGGMLDAMMLAEASETPDSRHQG